MQQEAIHYCAGGCTSEDWGEIYNDGDNTVG